ncbi:MAG: right-handed parallel beta-helix repeat-containing protein [Myxococcales bacterium]|nr:right-handed parallel beta-helix repeat-containing protein [Myxococcales bacterium]MCB9704318.1 right-handed parallel beta-helix repeat-containing protein [Myxococcales bacterium]
MIRTSLVSLSLPLALVLAACAGGPPSVTDTASSSDSDSDGTSTGNPTTTGQPTSTTAPTSTTGVPETTGSSGSTTGNPSTSTTTGEPPECTAPDGEVDQACDAATPFCQGGSCVDCSGAGGDSACAAADAASPVCEGGVCVECTADKADACSGTSPVCDTDSNACVGCTEHAQCGDTACNMADGSCFPTDYIIWVDRNAEDCMVGDGSMATPFCKITEAFDKIAEPDNLPAPWTVRIKPGTYIEGEHMTPGGSTMALIADGGAVTIRSTADSVAGLTTGDASTLFTQGLIFSLAQTSGLKCSASTVWATDTQMKNNSQHGVEAIDCDTFHKRSLITQNQKGGVASYGAGMTEIVNSYVTANGNLAAEFGGIRSAQGNELKILYTTMIGNDGDQAASIQCIDANGGEVRNSVVLGRTNNPSVDCMNAVVSYSLVDGGDMQGDNNMMGADSDVKTWFELPAGGIFRVKEMVDDLPSPIAEVAMWMDGDPKYDYDGDMRPADMGFPGADTPAL